MRKVVVLFIFCISWFAASAEKILQVKVLSVIDGNTLIVLTPDNDDYRLVLNGIDSPELQQEFGEEAKKYLEKLLLNKQVEATFLGKDRWGNTISTIKLKNGKDVREELVKQGYAWSLEKAEKFLKELENEARSLRKGLWKHDNPTPPWEYRIQVLAAQPKING